MVKYIAILDIGEYKVGDEVPSDKAELWLNMYPIPHLKIAESVEVEPITIDKKRRR